ncbi:MAG: iron ABC transporter, partial [Planctomycetota bacterium]
MFLIDLVMMGLVTLTVVVGLQAVGLILVVALLIVPGAGARFWTDRMLGMVLL